MQKIENDVGTQYGGNHDIGTYRPTYVQSNFTLFFFFQLQCTIIGNFCFLLKYVTYLRLCELVRTYFLFSFQVRQVQTGFRQVLDFVCFNGRVLPSQGIPWPGLSLTDFLITCFGVLFLLFLWLKHKIYLFIYFTCFKKSLLRLLHR